MDEPASWQRPSPRLRTVRRTQAGLALTLVTVALAVLADLGVGWPGVLGVAVAGLLAGCLLWRTTQRQWRAWGYTEREADLLVRRGVLIRRVSVVPYGRMQFVDVTAGPLDRRLGLATVHLHTAAAASDARIPGLPTAEAARLRDRLTALGEARAAGL